MSTRATRLPDFVLIGAQKAGTTMLMKALRDHPAVHIAALPPHWTEMHFFDKDQNWSRGVPWYESHFDRPHQLQGEKTPDYLSSPIAIQRMAETIPDAKLIVLLRDPVERAYSQWNHYNQEADRWRESGWEVLPFEEAIDRSRQQPQTVFGQLLRKGIYASQLAKVFEHFDRSQLFVGITERWRQAPDEEYEHLLEFLGLESVSDGPSDAHVREYKHPMSSEMSSYLGRYFAHYNEQLFELLGEDVPEWRHRAQRTPQVVSERKAPFGAGFDVCFVTTCMGRLEHLQESLPRMLSQPNACAIVVDYSCPQGAGDWVEENFDSHQVLVVRVNGQSEYNRAIARNAGALVPASDWVAMVDADTLLPDNFFDAQFREFCDGRFYVLVEYSQRLDHLPEGMKDLYGFVVARSGDIKRVGGYDEVLKGWGAEDVDLRGKLIDAGLEEVRLFCKMPDAIAHADTDRTKHHQFAGKRMSNAINLFYSNVKRDVANLVGVKLSVQQRQALYESVCNEFRKAVSSGKSSRIEVPLPNKGLEKGAQMGRRLVYELKVNPDTFDVSDLPR